MEIIDSHSHIGYDWCWGEANITGYEKAADIMGITTTLIMPSPGQIDFKSGKRIILYNYDENGFSYSSQLENQRPTVRIINDQVFNIVKKYNGNLNIRFVPLIHPILENYEYLYELKDMHNPVAFKIHGVATGVTPNSFSKEYIKHLEKLNIPIIVHTDYLDSCEEKFSIRNENIGYEWCKFFVNNDLKGYITHASRLDPRALEMINKHENLVIGCGPDKLMPNNPNRLFKDLISNTNDINVLKLLKENLEIDKILFDVDYSWNVTDSKTRELDYEGVKRVKEVFKEKEEYQKVLSLNAKKFFNI